MRLASRALLTWFTLLPLIACSSSEEPGTDGPSSSSSGGGASSGGGTDPGPDPDADSGPGTGSSGSSSGGEADAGPDAASPGGNGVKDGTETDIDCGGGAPGVSPCADDKVCEKAADCTSAFCNAQLVCKTPTGTDEAKNGDESDVDCGGTTTGAPRCETDRTCNGAPDCVSLVCAEAGVCNAATGTDEVKNGDESDVDCGGTTTGAPRCDLDEGCVRPADCVSLVCGADGKCDAPLGTDGVKNGDESDIDCGGTTTGARRCEPEETCNRGADCAEKVCNGAGSCAFPAYNDQQKNGNETDVDCGGDLAHPCATGKICAAHTDCSSKGCDYTQHCAERASCTQQDGGDTCRRENGTQENCCKSISVPASTKGGPAFKVDKFMATAGRMRSFLGRVDGNVYGYITANKPTWWDDRWTEWLPRSWNGHENNAYNQPVIAATVRGYANADVTFTSATAFTVNAGAAVRDLTVRNVNLSSTWAQVGGGILFDQASQGCYIGAGSYGHPTYLVPRGDANNLYGDDYERWMTQAALDQRPINCTNWPVLAALCAFDGGKLISLTQYDYLYDDDGFNAATSTSTRSTYPWGSPPAMVCPGGALADGKCCADAQRANGKCVTQAAWTPAANYDKVNNPHPGGRAIVGGLWTLVGPGSLDFSTIPCPDCVEDRVNWRFSYQDPDWNPYAANLTAAEQTRRSRDQSYFISVPGTFPKGGSRVINGDRVQDLAGLMFEAALPGSANNANVRITFGNADAADDLAVVVPTARLVGGSFEGHDVGGPSTYNIPTKYGKMSARCVY